MKKKDVSAYLKRNDIAIENNVASWDIAVNGDINGLYSGQFKFKCYLTPIERLAAGRFYREILGSQGMLATKHEDNLAFSISQLKYRVISAPPFWSSAIGLDGTFGDLPDENVLDAILEAAISAEFKFKAQLEEKKKDVVEKAKKAAEKMLFLNDEKELEDEDLE